MPLMTGGWGAASCGVVLLCAGAWCLWHQAQEAGTGTDLAYVFIIKVCFMFDFFIFRTAWLDIHVLRTLYTYRIIENHIGLAISLFVLQQIHDIVPFPLDKWTRWSNNCRKRASSSHTVKSSVSDNLQDCWKTLTFFSYLLLMEEIWRNPAGARNVQITSFQQVG